jgi:hypothetical protein
MKKVTLILLALFIAVSASREKRPFSVGALQWLLQREEYDRFDWYIERYLWQHPDTAVLYILQANRYFKEALTHRHNAMKMIEDQTGGIPRKYPSYIVPSRPVGFEYVKQRYSNRLLDNAFKAIRKARALQPDDKQLYLTLCTMAAQADRPAVLSGEVALAMHRFGCSRQLQTIVLDYIGRKERGSDVETMTMLVRSMMKKCPEPYGLMAELGKYFYFQGELDSSYYYTMRALFYDTKNIETMQHAIILASIRGDFPAAARLALQRYEQTGHPADCIQAALFTAPFDSAWAGELYAKALEHDTGLDTLSLATSIFDTRDRDENATNQNRFFGSDKFHLNFPLIELRFQRSKDKLTYYLHKAAAFYVYAQYDSAAYYNLNLLRNMTKKNELGYKSLFNLAAEYYASGEFILSYLRFLNIHNYYNGWNDISVRFALGVNYEQFGDYSTAMRHYRYVLSQPEDNDAKNYDLHKHTLYRLKQLQTKHLE